MGNWRFVGLMGGMYNANADYEDVTFYKAISEIVAIFASTKLAPMLKSFQAQMQANEKNQNQSF